MSGQGDKTRKTGRTKGGGWNWKKKQDMFAMKMKPRRVRTQEELK